MKRMFLLLSAAAVFSASPILTGCKKAGDSTTSDAAKQYTCPHHPEVVANAPGKCPKCNMDLIVKK
jgi:hypothetical protein